MRDPKRIWRITNKLFELWTMVPDQRFGQMLENYLYPAVIDSKHRTAAIVDWHLEDENLEKRLDKVIHLMKQQKKRGD